MTRRARLDCGRDCVAFVVYATGRQRLDQESITGRSTTRKNSVTGGRPGYFLVALYARIYARPRALSIFQRAVCAAIIAVAQAAAHASCYAKFAWVIAGFDCVVKVARKANKEMHEAIFNIQLG